jgi:hypothetical protein
MARAVSANVSADVTYLVPGGNLLMAVVSCSSSAATSALDSM